MTPENIIRAVIVSVAFYGGWHLKSVINAAQENERVQQTLRETQQSAAASIRRMDNVLAAQNAAAVRSVELRRDRDRALSELERLRLALSSAVPGNETSTAACTVRTDPARELFAECAAALVEMGGRADRHASDVQALMDAWPK